MLARRTSFIALIYDPGDGVFAHASYISRGVIGESGYMIGYVYMNTSTFDSTTITWQKSTDSGVSFSTVTHGGDNSIVYDDVVVYGSETGRYRGRTSLTINNLENSDYALYRIKAEHGGDTHHSGTFDFSNPA
tara:strand:+ start:639 stop:1037 length:399 start_codon:yes stop_codon:yes gene_type:complete